MTDPERKSSRHIHETFSQAYGKLVENNADIVGMVAYCIYKKQKALFVENLVSRHRSISRRSRRIEAFHHDFFDDSHVADLRNAAEARLSTYVKEFTDEAKNKAYREIAQDRDGGRQIAERGDRSKTLSSWIFAVSSSLAAAIILGVFVDLDEYFPTVDPFPDAVDRQADWLQRGNDNPFAVEPAAAAPILWDRAVM